VFDPDRYTEGREEDKNLDAWQPFGGGKHKCSGNAFAMFQIKAIFCILLRRYDFELVDSLDKYVDDYTQMIVQPKAPCRVRYKRRAGAGGVTPARTATQQTVSDTTTSATSSGCPFSGGKSTTVTKAAFSINLDKMLCQGHAVCMGEAPELFRVDKEGNTTVLTENIKPDLLEKALKAEKFCPNQAIKITVNS
jgi:sterol 14-demethylase